MATLSEISDGLAAAVEVAGKSTVHVDARRGRGASGIVWAEGVVVTSSHVVESDEEITVSDGERDYKASVAGRDGATDLAVLKVEGLGAPAAARGAGVRVGQPAHQE